MAFLIGKIFFELLSPLGLSLLGLVVAATILRRHHPKWARRLQLAIPLCLGILSLPVVSKMIGMPLESTYASRPIAEYPMAGAIVVLGGTTGRKEPPRFEAEEVMGSRLLPAARLYHAGKAKVIIVSGGVPYLGTNGEIRCEADDMQEVLVDLGVPAKAIVKEKQSRNTRENAQYTANLLKIRLIPSILLVTQAVHMRRAAAIFRKIGVPFTPVPTGPLFTSHPLGILDFIPSAPALAGTTGILKEYLGTFLVWL